MTNTANSVRAGLLFLAAAVAVAMLAGGAAAQQPADGMHRIGYLTAGSKKAFAKRLAAFRRGLGELGYREGRNIAIAERYAAGERKLLPGMAAELAGLGVDVFVTNGVTATRLADRAVRRAGKNIPVVFAIAADPVGAGLVASLARPGGNITGLSNATAILVPKRLALLKETLPTASRVAVLWSTRAKSLPAQIETLKAAAPGLGLTVVPVPFDRPEDFESAFAAVRSARADAINVLGWSLINTFRARIAARALEDGLPTMFTNPRAVAAGGLMSYGANVVEMYRQAASYVDKVLKGAKPADLPVERPNRFELVLNLKTARSLGLKPPPAILLRADEVVE